MSVRAIAKKLNLSASTVSLALRGSSKIAADTRRKVEQEAERIGYRCDAKLREMMARMRSSAVCPLGASLGFLTRRPVGLTEAGRRFRARARSGLAEGVGARGYSLDTFCIDEFSPARLRGILDARGIEGLFCFAADFAESGFADELSGLNIVAIGGRCAGSVGFVAPDYFGDMVECCRSLASGGFARVGLVLGADLERDAAERYLGAFLSQNSEGWLSPWLNLPGSGEANGVASRLASWLASKRPEAAIFAGLDHARATEAIERLGFAHPCQPVFMDLETGDGAGILRDSERIAQRAADLLIGAICRRGAASPGGPCIELVPGRWMSGGLALLADVEATC